MKIDPNAFSEEIRHAVGFMLRFMQDNCGHFGRWHTLIEDNNIGDVKPYFSDELPANLTEMEAEFADLIAKATERDQERLIALSDALTFDPDAAICGQPGRVVIASGVNCDMAMFDEEVRIDTNTGELLRKFSWQ